MLVGSFVLLAGAGVLRREDIRTAIHRQDLPALLERARALDAAGQSAQAGGAYTRLVARYPKREAALLAYAEHLDGLGESVEAEHWYRRAAATGRQHFSSVRRYAGFLEKEGREDEAVALYETYLAKYPDDYTAQFDLGLRRLWRRDYERAVPPFTASAADEALRLESLGWLGHAHHQLGQAQAALSAWQEAIALERGPQSALHWQDIARAQEKSGARDEAIAAWERYLAHFPNSLSAVRRLLRLRKEAGDDKAVRRLELRLRAMQPVQSLTLRASDGAQVLGIDPPGKLVPGEVATASVYVHFVRTVHDPEALALRCWCVDRGGSVIPIACAPASIASPPQWRGDGLCQRIALRLPETFEAGAHGIEMVLGPQSSARIPVVPVPKAEDGT